jgi:hypothetical protein
MVLKQSRKLEWQLVYAQFDFQMSSPPPPKFTRFLLRSKHENINETGNSV